MRGSDSLFVDHAPPVPAAVALATFDPDLKISTTTASVSLAVPLNVGLVLLEGELGWLSTTEGDLVSIVNVTMLLLPVLPASSVCSA